MAIDLLDAPLRVTWTLWRPAGPMSAPLALRIAAELGAAGVFEALLDGRPLRHPACAAVMQTLGDAGVRLQLVTDGSAEELASLVPSSRPPELFVDAAPFLGRDGFAARPLLAAFRRLQERGLRAALWLEPRRQVLPHLSALLQFCAEHAIPRFKLPNLDIDASVSRSAGGDVPSPADWERISCSLRSVAGETTPVVLDVHDRFLWEILARPGEAERLAYEGCQAGNSLAHIDVDGWIHPCSSWPYPLGNLADSRLEEIWAAPPRLAFRRALAAPPPGCEECADLADCRGGCRGLGVLFNAAQGARDPGCSGPR